MQKKSNTYKTMNHRVHSRRINAAVHGFEDAAKQRLEDLKGGVRATRRAASYVDRYSHKKPWIVVGVASFAAWILGFLFGIRRR